MTLDTFLKKAFDLNSGFNVFFTGFFVAYSS